MSWHHFEPGNAYQRAEIVAKCRARIASGRVLDVQQKHELVDAMDQAEAEMFVWTPLKPKGWWASPFNPHCWRTTNGAPMLSTAVAVPELRGDDEV